MHNVTQNHTEAEQNDHGDDVTHVSPAGDPTRQLILDHPVLSEPARGMLLAQYDAMLTAGRRTVFGATTSCPSWCDRQFPGVIDRIAHRLHNALHEGFLDVGPVRVMLRTFHDDQMQSSFECGRDYGRMEMGGPPVPSSRHLRGV